MFIWTDSLFPGFALASSKFFRIGLHHGFRMDFYGFEGLGLGFFSDLALVQVFFRIWMLVFQDLVFRLFKDQDIGFFRNWMLVFRIWIIFVC